MILDWWESFGYSTVILDIFDSTGGNTGQQNHVRSIHPTNGRSGGPCLQYVQGNTNAFAMCHKALTSAATKYMAVAYRCSVLPSPATSRFVFAFLESGTVQVDCRVNDNGDLFFTRNGTVLAGTTLTGVVTPNVYVHFQTKLVVDPSAGVIDVRLNGSASSAYGGEVTNLNTRATAVSAIDSVELRCGGSGELSLATVHFSDPVVADGWPGERRVDYFPCNAAGNSTQWTPSTGSNHTTIDETGSKDTADYNATSTVSQKDTFNLDNLPTTADLLAVCPMGLFSKQDAGGAECAFVVRQGTTDYDGANFSPPFGSNQYFKEALLENPNNPGNPFTASEFNSGEIGYKRTT